MPVRWDEKSNIRWSAPLTGEGSSSPIVWNHRVFITAARDEGTRRVLYCLDRDSGRTLWQREIDDENPELTSALTGHAASTPATDGEHVVAFFGNAGIVCYDFDGKQCWRRRLGEFESELGLASSPVLYRDLAIIVCDHDGDRFHSFDSFLLALDVKTGKTRWKTSRRGLFRSWSTPILVARSEGGHELIVNGQDELRGYNPENGEQLWVVRGMTVWVTPSPVFGKGLIFASSGKNGPTMAVRPGGRGDVTETNVVWIEKRGAPYVCSPLFVREFLYVHDEQGILTCYEATTGRVHYRTRLEGKFMASPVAGDNKLYLTNDAGVTFVIEVGDRYVLLAKNSLKEECLASPAISGNHIFIRTRHHLHCLSAGSKAATEPFHQP